MSWIFGCIGNPPQYLLDQFPKTHDSPDYHILKNGLYLAAGGNRKTTFFSKPSKSKGWIVCGVGMGTETSKPHLYSHSDWQTWISSGQKSPDGHFISLAWQKDMIHIQTDPLGLRDIYLSKFEDYTLLSTRPDWIANIHPLKLDVDAMGTKWFPVVPLSNQSLFENCQRFSTGDKVIISKNEFHVESHDWTDNIINTQSNDWTFTQENLNHLSEQFISIITAPLQSKGRLSLSLSAGFDSRFLLSCLIASNCKNWDVHSFGPDALPDNLVSKRMTDTLNIPHRRYNDPLPTLDESIQLIETYTSQSMLTDTVTTVLQLRYYQHFQNRDEVLIDGWGGEYWTREFFNKLLYLGKSAILNRDANAFLKLLEYHRGGFFTNDFEKQMHAGSVNIAQQMLDSLPDVSAFGLANWIDLLSIKTKLPNAMGPEQARVDSIVQNYMPLVQPILLKEIFKIPVNLRKDGKLLRQIIYKTAPQTTQFPLVKNVTKKPFGMTSLQARIWEKCHHTFGKPYQNMDKIIFLENLRTYIGDLYLSESVQNSQIYNKQKLASIIHPFLKGNRDTLSQVDWWLTFELFRKHHRLF